MDITQESTVSFASLAYSARARSAEAVAGATGGTWQNWVPDMVFAQISSDSRAIAPKALFVALCGASFDGHAYVEDAARAGAQAAVVSRLHPLAPALRQRCRLPLLWVEDTLSALGDLAHSLRHERSGPVVGITGSNGKTTVKELVASILAEQGVVHKTYGNLNNLIGVPQTLFAWPENAWAAVVEMGMNAPGEIARLTQIAEPTLGLITCVAPAHLLGLKTLEKVARAKLELAQALLPARPLILNADDSVLMREARATVDKDRPCLYFGTGAEADVAVIATCPEGPRAQRITLRIGPGAPPTTFILPLVGRHNAQNAAAAAAVGLHLGMSAESITRGLSSAQIPGGRLRLVEVLPRQLLILDDSYNANPGSMRAALETLVAQASLPPGHRTVAVLGDMLELGPEADIHHRALGHLACALKVGQIFAVGAHAVSVAQGASEKGGSVAVCDDYAALETRVLATLRPSDFLLVKGSRGMRLERLVRRLQEA